MASNFSFFPYKTRYRHTWNWLMILKEVLHMNWYARRLSMVRVSIKLSGKMDLT